MTTPVIESTLETIDLGAMTIPQYRLISGAISAVLISYFPGLFVDTEAEDFSSRYRILSLLSLQALEKEVKAVKDADVLALKDKMRALAVIYLNSMGLTLEEESAKLKTGLDATLSAYQASQQEKAEVQSLDPKLELLN